MLFQKAPTARKLAALSYSHAMIEFTPEGTIISANALFGTCMGYDPSELPGKHHSLFIRKEDRDSADYKRFWQNLRDGKHCIEEFLRIRKDGSEVWIQGSYVPVTNDRGQVVSVLKLATDITARKIRRSDHAGQIEAIRATQAVIEFDTEGKILEANAIFCQTMGYDRSELIGQQHSLFITPAERSTDGYRKFWSDLRQGKAHIGEFHRVGKNGKDVWINASYTPISDPSGRVWKVVKYAQDITQTILRRQERGILQKSIEQELGQISSDADRAADQAANAAQASTETSGKVQDVAAGVEELSSSIREISTQVNQALDISQKAVAQAEETNTLVEGLVAAAGEIDKVIRLINDIASQTNLLALNATIEAARAGDAGKGFAVVANEVKGLASQTTRATEEIASQVSAVQSATEQAVTAIRSITTTIEQVNGISSNIAAAVEEQTAVTSGISTNMQVAAEGVDAVVDSIGEIAEATSRINQATSTVREAASRVT
jgi:methyl-accepting chemotaxis protein